jgi:hypothetical protein
MRPFELGQAAMVVCHRKNINRAYLEIEVDSFDKWLLGSG